MTRQADRSELKQSLPGTRKTASNGEAMGRLREQMKIRYERFGDLQDPGLLALSSRLDEIVIEEMRRLHNKGRRSPG